MQQSQMGRFPGYYTWFVQQVTLARWSLRDSKEGECLEIWDGGEDEAFLVLVKRLGQRNNKKTRLKEA